MTEKRKRRTRTRANGEGSVYTRASDGRAVGAITLPNGKRKVVYGATKKAVREEMQKIQNAIDEGRPITSGRGVTLEQYLREWTTKTLPARVAAGRMRQSTLDSYAENIRLHIVPELGREQLTKLSPVKVRTWLTGLSDKPSGRQRKPTEEEPNPPVVKLSARTVQYAHAVLRKALADAVRDELVPRNVAALVEPPLVRGRKAQPLTVEEAQRVLAAAAGSRLATLWLLILALGLRRGEALGLRWEHVDLEAGTVTLSKGLQRQRGAADPETGKRKGRLVEAELKTDASKATLALPARVVEALRTHRAAQAAERLKAKVWVDPGLVFTTSVGTPLEPRNVNRAWNALCDDAGVRRVRVHDLRHTAASYLFAAGVDMKVVQHQLRHTRLATTSDIYTHVLEDVQRGAADRMDDVLGRLGGQQS